jgi:hypothetical protein
MKKYYFILALILLSLTACKKDKHINGPGTPPQQQLPPITTEGKNTFGCLVNGEVWLPEVKPFQMFVYPLTSGYEFELFHVAANKLVKNSQDEFIFADVIVLNANLNSTGSIILNNLNNSYARYSNILTGCSYEVDSIQTGTLNILKYDTINFIISGTFEFTVGTGGCDTIKITEGRFDLKYAQ